MRLRKKFVMLGIASAGMFGLTACGSPLADSCEDFYEFDQEYATGIEQMMATGTDPDASDEDKAEAQEFMQDASDDFQELIADAEDEEFLSAAQNALPAYELFEQVVDPNISPAQQMELFQSGEMQSGMEAETELIEMCNAELN